MGHKVYAVAMSVAALAVTPAAAVLALLFVHVSRMDPTAGYWTGLAALGVTLELALAPLRTEARRRAQIRMPLVKDAHARLREANPDLTPAQMRSKAYDSTMALFSRRPDLKPMSSPYWVWAIAVGGLALAVVLDVPSDLLVMMKPETSTAGLRSNLLQSSAGWGLWGDLGALAGWIVALAVLMSTTRTWLELASVVVLVGLPVVVLPSALFFLSLAGWLTWAIVVSPMSRRVARRRILNSRRASDRRAVTGASSLFTDEPLAGSRDAGIGHRTQDGNLTTEPSEAQPVGLGTAEPVMVNDVELAAARRENEELRREGERLRRERGELEQAALASASEMDAMREENRQMALRLELQQRDLNSMEERLNSASALDPVWWTLADRLSPGFQLAGFSVQGVLGRTAMSTVYVGLTGPNANGVCTPVAIKCVRTGDPGDQTRSAEELTTRARREAHVISQIQSTHMPRFISSGMHQDQFFIATTALPYPNLDRRISSAGVFDKARDLVQLGASLASALSAVHGHDVVHRDVKPANVLWDGNVGYLLDLGIAASDRFTKLTDPVLGVLGSAFYVAPERVEHPSAPDRPTADVWGWGAVLFFAATGRTPHPDGRAWAAGRMDLTPLRESVADKSLQRVIEAALDPRPDCRPRSGHELWAEVGLALGP